MSELLNMIGLSTGVVLYAMLLVMVLRAGRVPVRGGDPGHARILLVAAALGLTWNLCALPAYELQKAGVAGPFPWLIAVGFCALGFLPAVVVDSILREGSGVRTGLASRVIIVLVYAASTTAALIQMLAVGRGHEVPSPAAMWLLTVTFVTAVVPLVLLTKDQPGARRALWISAFAAFAVTALHLTQLHHGEGSWLVELLGHHASLPLAFAILYQDYPFALADLFLKRALTLLAVVAAAFVAIAVVSDVSDSFATFVRVDPWQVAALVTMWIGTVMVYPGLRRATARFVDAVLLRRPDYPSVRAAAMREAQEHDTEPALLDAMCALLGPAMSARSVSWRELPSSAGPGSTMLVARSDRTIVNIPTVEDPRYAIEISRLTGGRRILSDDLSALEAIALTIGRRVDAMRITRERYARVVREEEMAKLASQAELRALRAQINPHFLFNAMTTIGYLIQTSPDRAFETLMRLTSLLRGVLGSDKDLTTLGRELEIVESYLEIERARFDERLRIRIDVPRALYGLRLPPLLLQPLVENAVKHGIGVLVTGGEITITAAIERTADGDSILRLAVRDTGAGSTPEAFARRRSQGVGLQNVERRLACQYGAASALTFETAVGCGTTITLRLPVEPSAARVLAVSAP